MIREEQFNINDRVKIIANSEYEDCDWSIGRYGIIIETTNNHEYPYKIKIENHIYDNGEQSAIACKKEELELAKI